MDDVLQDRIDPTAAAGRYTEAPVYFPDPRWYNIPDLSYQSTFLPDEPCQGEVQLGTMSTR
jgi:hypothetical protein